MKTLDLQRQQTFTEPVLKLTVFVLRARLATTLGVAFDNQVNEAQRMIESASAIESLTSDQIE